MKILENVQARIQAFRARFGASQTTQIAAYSGGTYSGFTAIANKRDEPKVLVLRTHR